MNVVQWGDRGLTDVTTVSGHDDGSYVWQSCDKARVMECVHMVWQQCVWMQRVWELNWMWDGAMQCNVVMTQSPLRQISDPVVRLLLWCAERRDVVRCVMMWSPLRQIFWSWGKATTSVHCYIIKITIWDLVYTTDNNVRCRREKVVVLLKSLLKSCYASEVLYTLSPDIASS
jgi:hypothetical protein